MNRLRQIHNWPELARHANWSVAALAKQCSVSVRKMHRHFLRQMGTNTKVWLADQRQAHALELLHAGFSVKETAFRLGYKHPTNFTREYKRHWGICPSMQSPLTSPSQTVNVRK